MSNQRPGETPVLDLGNYYDKKEYGDITVYFTWFGPSFQASRPCIAIAPTFKRRGFKPYILPLNNAWTHHEDVEGPEQLLNSARQCIESLGLDDTMSNVHKIATVIHSHIGDLLQMPPRPLLKESAGAIARIRNRDSGKEIEFDIMDQR